jgi:transposase-like protein
VHLRGLTHVIASVTRDSAAIWTSLERYEQGMATPSVHCAASDQTNLLEDSSATSAILSTWS